MPLVNKRECLWEYVCVTFLALTCYDVRPNDGWGAVESRDYGNKYVIVCLPTVPGTWKRKQPMCIAAAWFAL